MASPLEGPEAVDVAAAFNQAERKGLPKATGAEPDADPAALCSVGVSPSSARATAPNGCQASRCHAGTPAASSSSSCSSNSLLDLGPDLLALVASHCGASAPALAQACRATQCVWLAVRRQAMLLAQVLADTDDCTQDPCCGAPTAAPPASPGAAQTQSNAAALQAVLARGVARVLSDLEATRTLLQAGADVHADSDDALWRAADRGDTQLLQLLLLHGADVHAAGDYALRCAASQGRSDLAQLLLAAGADVHASGEEALLFAVLHGHVQLVQLLLAAGADARVLRGMPLRWAARYGHARVMEVLLKHCYGQPAGGSSGSTGPGAGGAGAGPDSIPVQGGQQGLGFMDLSLEEAAVHGDECMVALLLVYGADPNGGDGAALVRAAGYGHDGVVAALLRGGADVRAYGGTALRAAGEAGHTSTMELLAEAAEAGAAAVHAGEAEESAAD